MDAADFALEDGLLPRNLGQGTIWAQLGLLAEKAGLGRKQIETVWSEMLSDQPAVEALLHASFLEERHKRSYLQAYRTRLRKLRQQTARAGEVF